jgi:tRNA-binding EMAP/Myf-like protein
VACNGNKTLTILDINDGKIKGRIANSSGRSNYYALEKCPGFNNESKPFVFLKDDRFISVINVATKTVLRIIKSQCNLSTNR